MTGNEYVFSDGINIVNLSTMAEAWGDSAVVFTAIMAGLQSED
ncbi:hypothetical protein FHX48_002769 [Microbacterium halimionae]|uniref:Uncharacterized protein n=1 Tax=Microbacterium halimionae TaxID=1526413 RepID=A0A7W3PN71_9MICO|nr:hypothetical protein [Microbacterium halimionae]MBA8817664.1 hypothetical protein [Microbacterium halimionae]NII94757.1 hypothetical protein [Microbacterium halimionae]